MLTPYARAHLRLQQIGQRFNEIVRKRNLTRSQWIAIRHARNQGNLAQALVNTDQEHFDEEVHPEKFYDYGHSHSDLALQMQRPTPYDPEAPGVEQAPQERTT